MLLYRATPDCRCWGKALFAHKNRTNVRITAHSLQVCMHMCWETYLADNCYNIIPTMNDVSR